MPMISKPMIRKIPKKRNPRKRTKKMTKRMTRRSQQSPLQEMEIKVATVVSAASSRMASQPSTSRASRQLMVQPLETRELL